MADESKEKQTTRGRGPRKVTPGYLERAALHYLERFATSSENLRRVLTRRVVKSARHHGTDPEEAAPWIDELIARFQVSGLLDDGAYAEARAASLFRRGDSLRAIQAKLAAKGVGRDEIEAAIAALREEVAREPDSADADSDPDRQAAANYVRRRRIGPYRSPEVRAAYRDRDLAALARAGFGYEVARSAVDGETGDGEE